jgi:hypothetical protein
MSLHVCGSARLAAVLWPLLLLALLMAAHTPARQ